MGKNVNADEFKNQQREVVSNREIARFNEDNKVNHDEYNSHKVVNENDVFIEDNERDDKHVERTDEYKDKNIDKDTTSKTTKIVHIVETSAVAVVAVAAIVVASPLLQDVEEIITGSGVGMITEAMNYVGYYQNETIALSIKATWNSSKYSDYQILFKNESDEYRTNLLEFIEEHLTPDDRNSATAYYGYFDGYSSDITGQDSQVFDFGNYNYVDISILNGNDKEVLYSQVPMATDVQDVEYINSNISEDVLFTYSYYSIFYLENGGFTFEFYYPSGDATFGSSSSVYISNLTVAIKDVHGTTVSATEQYEEAESSSLSLSLLYDWDNIDAEQNPASTGFIYNLGNKVTMTVSFTLTDIAQQVPVTYNDTLTISDIIL